MSTLDNERLLEIAEQKRMTRINYAESMYNLDMALIAALTGSALDAMANLGPKSGLIFPEEFADGASIGLGVGLDGLKVTIEAVPGVVPELTFIELGLNKVQSSNVSAFASEVRAARGSEGEGELARIYIRYKGGGLYRYYPYRYSNYVDLVTITRQMSQSLPTTLTVGEYVNRVIKSAHEQGRAICEKLEGNDWVVVMTKAQKDAAKQGQAASDKLFGSKEGTTAEPMPEQVLDAIGEEPVREAEPVVTGEPEPIYINCPVCNEIAAVRVKDEADAQAQGLAVILDHGVNNKSCEGTGMEVTLATDDSHSPDAPTQTTTEQGSGTGSTDEVLDIPAPVEAPVSQAPTTPPEVSTPESGSTGSMPVPTPTAGARGKGREADF